MYLSVTICLISLSVCLMYLSTLSIYLLIYSVPRREAQGFLMSPPVWNFRAVSLILLFYMSSLVLLPSSVARSVISFSAVGPFSRLVFP